MAEITIRGQAYALDLFKGLEGDALDEKLLEINGVGEKTLPKVRETVLSALADETSTDCHNFDKCGNEAEEGHDYCADCHLTWRRQQVSQKDRETRPVRLDTVGRRDKAGEYYARYYKSEDPQKWPKEVREAFLAAVAAIAEGDRQAKKAANKDNPNPGLFQVARFHYFQVHNHLAVASFHSSRASARGVLKGLSILAQRRLEEALAEAEKAMSEAEKLQGYKKTRALQRASYAMRDALTAARKERTSMNKVEADDFYSEGVAMEEFLSDDQVKKLNRQHKRRQAKARGN